MTSLEQLEAALKEQNNTRLAPLGFKTARQFSEEWSLSYTHTKTRLHDAVRAGLAECKKSWPANYYKLILPNKLRKK